MNDEELAVVHDEVEIMHKIQHEHCVQLFEMFETNKKIYMILELLTGGELFDRIVSKGSYSEKEASEVIASVTSAIQYLHNIGVVHRDLKPENLIYLSPADDSPIKITDFGLAKYRSNKASEVSNMTTACGTPGYVAPEVLKNEPYNKAVDMWSLGVILYILLCGFPPFYHESTAALYKQIKKGQYDFPSPYWDEISDSAKDLVRALLTVDPKHRYTAAQVLAHPWITGGASSKPLDSGHSQRLMMLQARRRLRKGVQMIIAINKFGNTVEMLQREAQREAAAQAQKEAATAGSSK